MIDLLFGSLDEVLIIIDPEDVARAEEIFRRFNGRQVVKRTGFHSFMEGGFHFDPNTEHPNRVMLTYLIDAKRRKALTDNLFDENVAGTGRHNPVYSRPYSLKERIAAWYHSQEEAAED